MNRRRAPWAAALLLAVLVASGCSAAPAPTEPTPLFSTEAEAFAAAEATYRAYVDALNERRKGDSPRIDAQKFLIGQALEDDLATLRALDSEGVRIVGDSAIAGFTGLSDSPSKVRAVVCIDASDTTVEDELGNDVTPMDRTEETSLDVTFVVVGRDLLISESVTSADDSC